jgi:HD-like signal output (HDOD) protein
MAPLLSTHEISGVHRRRVNTIAMEVARSLDPARGVAPAMVLDRGRDFGRDALSRLAMELSASRLEASRVPRPDPAASEAPPLEVAAEIVRLCEILDEQLESLPFEYRHIDVLLDELETIAKMEGVRRELVEVVRSLRYRELESGADLGRHLPVEAGLAQQVFRALGNEREYDVADLETLAQRDPVLSGSIIRVANSALYSPDRRIGTVRQGISYIGTVATRQLLLAAVMRPLFVSAGLLRLWTHAVQMGQLYGSLASQTDVIAPGEALLLGLVHDIGSLAVHMLPRAVVERYQRLTEHGGCPPAYVEQLLFGADHGELGAGILDSWRFPEHLVEAVRFHHQPERSASMTVALLYLTEFWSGLDEDLPSFVRVEGCTRRTGLSLESLACVRIPQDALYLLRTVA